jgi:tetratricopeptide (TPR) repeat protein
MMNKDLSKFAPRIGISAALLLLAGSVMLSAQAPQPNPAPTPAAPTPAAAQPKADQPEPNHAVSYYHAGLAGMYEDEAINEGHPDQVIRAIEEYKLALNADPTSPQLNDELAELYFRTGRVHDAEVTTGNLLKTSPNDIPAHKLLGRILLRELGEGQTAAAPAASKDALEKAIAEFEKIVALEPKTVEDRLVLGQLYTVKHDQQKAEEAFKAAAAIEPDSEEVVLNLARLYSESGDNKQAVKVIEAVPVGDRSTKMELTLGSLYDQLKQPKDAIAAYKRAADQGAGDPQTLDALAQALMNDNQLDEALAQYRELSENDPENSEALIHIAEILRRKGKFEDALTTIRRARKLDPTSLEAGFNEGMVLDVLDRLDEAAQTYQAMVDLTSHANGAYTTEEKSNRGIFLERLGAIDLERNKTAEAVATYQKMIDMGGDSVIRGYQGQVDAYRGAHDFDKAVEVARKAAASDPNNRDLKLMLAGELADNGKADEGLAMARSLLKDSSDDRPIYLAIAQMNLRLRRWKDAEDALAKAEPLSTKKEDRTYLYFMRGELAERQKHYDAAEQAFKQVLEQEPDSAMALNYYGYMLADKGIRLQDALKMIRKAVDQEPWNGAYLDSLGWAYFKLGEYELAEDNLRQAVERDQTDPTVHMHMGDLYEKTGRIRLAAAQWQLALDEFAKSSPADIEQSDVARVQKKLESARVKLAKQDDSVTPSKPE